MSSAHLALEKELKMNKTNKWGNDLLLGLIPLPKITRFRRVVGLISWITFAFGTDAFAYNTNEVGGFGYQICSQKL